MADPLPALVTNNVVRVTITSRTNGVLCQTTHDYRNTGIISMSLADLTAFATNFQSTIETLYLACLSPLSVLVDYNYQELHFGTCPSYTNSVASPPGTAGATNQPLEMATTITRYGNWKGRHGRGRFSMPAIPNTFSTPATDANVLNATGLAAYGALAAAFLGTINSGFDVFTPFISTRPVAPATLVTMGVDVASLSVRSTFGTARRRKPGRGI